MPKPLIQTTKVSQRPSGQQPARIIENPPASTVAQALANSAKQVKQAR